MKQTSRSVVQVRPGSGSLPAFLPAALARRHNKPQVRIGKEAFLLEAIR
jgi:hypothetical protein